MRGPSGSTELDVLVGRRPEAAAETVGEGVEVGAEIAAGSVDGPADRVVEVVDRR